MISFIYLGDFQIFEKVFKNFSISNSHKNKLAIPTPFLKTIRLRNFIFIIYLTIYGDKMNTIKWDL